MSNRGTRLQLAAAMCVWSGSMVAGGGDRQARTDVVAAVEAPQVASAEVRRHTRGAIRPVGERIASLLTLGLERSAILERLASRVESGNVIVYVAFRKNVDRRLDASLAFAGDAGRHRYLRVTLNPRLSADHIIASLAHELQHVIEIIESPRVRSEADMASLYWRIGRVSRASGRVAWETDRARQIGDAVWLELQALADAEGEREPC